MASGIRAVLCAHSVSSEGAAACNPCTVAEKFLGGWL